MEAYKMRHLSPPPSVTPERPSEPDQAKPPKALPPPAPPAASTPRPATPSGSAPDPAPAKASPPAVAPPAGPAQAPPPVQMPPPPSATLERPTEPDQAKPPKAAPPSPQETAVYRPLEAPKGIDLSPLDYQQRYLMALALREKPPLPDGWRVYRSIPLQLQGHPALQGMDINALENLRGVRHVPPEGGVSRYDELTTRWNEFLKDSNNLSREKILQFRDQLDREYGSQFWETNAGAGGAK